MGKGTSDKLRTVIARNGYVGGFRFTPRIHIWFSTLFFVSGIRGMLFLLRWCQAFHAQTLHPQRKTRPFFFTPHHQRPSAVGGNTMKQGWRGLGSLQDSIRVTGDTWKSSPSGRLSLTMGMQQSAVLLIHTAHVLPGLRPGGLLTEGKGSVHPPSNREWIKPERSPD